MKHTPGPWRVNTTHLETRVVMADKRIATVHQCITKYDYLSVPVQQQVANAQLIAAAPDLLETLENLLLACEYCKPERILTSKAVLLARQAIAKAKGE